MGADRSASECIEASREMYETWDGGVYSVRCGSCQTRFRIVSLELCNTVLPLLCISAACSAWSGEPTSSDASFVLLERALKDMPCQRGAIHLAKCMSSICWGQRTDFASERVCTADVSTRLDPSRFSQVSLVWHIFRLRAPSKPIARWERLMTGVTAGPAW